MRSLIVLSACLALAGCATYEGGVSAYETNDTIGQSVAARYSGRPIDEMITRYGIPTRQMQTAQGEVMNWDAATSEFQGQYGHWTRRLDAYVTPERTGRQVGLAGQFGACVRFRP